MYNLMVDVRTVGRDFDSSTLKDSINVTDGVCIANFNDIKDAIKALLSYKNSITYFNWGSIIAETFYLARQGEMILMLE